MKSWKWLAAALGCGIALRLWMIHTLAQVAGDSLLYGMFARNMLLHHVYGFSVLRNGVAMVQPTLIRLPGYPLFLAACFRIFGVENYQAVLDVQVAIDLTTCLLLAATAWRIFGRKAFWAALWLGVLCPFTANYVAYPLTETLTLFTIALAIYGLTRWRMLVRTQGPAVNFWLFTVAAALAYSILLRPEQGLLAAAVVPAMAWTLLSRHGVRAAVWPVLLVSLLTILPLAPWAWRNWQTFHVIQPLAPKQAIDPGDTAPLGFQRWYRTWAIDFASTGTVYWQYDGQPIYVSDLPRRAFDSPAQYEETAAVIDLYDDTNSPSPAVDARFAKIAGERIAANPLRYYVLLPVARVLNMIFRPRLDQLPVPLEWWHFRERPRSAIFAACYAALNLGYMALAGLVLVRRRYDRVLVAAMLATIVLRCLLLLTIDNSEPRYTLEFFPVLIVLAAGWWQRPPVDAE